MQNKINLLSVFLLLSMAAFSQRDRVYLTLDKYSCRAGDTVWFKGVVFKGYRPHSLSTNLYVALYNKNGKTIKRYMFPIIHAQSFGQVVVPKDLPTDNYYIAALTKQQLNYDTTEYFSLPLMVYNKDRPRIVLHQKSVTPLPFASEMLDNVWWLTTIYHKNQISSHVEIDSCVVGLRRRLTLTCLFDKHLDTLFSVTVTLDSLSKSKYLLFPIDFASNFAYLSLYRDTTLIGRQLIRLKQPKADVSLTTDTLDNAADGYNSWRIILPDSLQYFSSVSVTDLDRSRTAPLSIEVIKNCRADNFTIADRSVDTEYIALSGKATRTYGKKIKDPFKRQLVVMGSSDSTILFTKTADIDDTGYFHLGGLYYFGNIKLNVQFNQMLQDDSRKDVALHFSHFEMPDIDSFRLRYNWDDDSSSLINQTDTVLTAREAKAFDLSKAKTLQSVTVHGWKNLRKELDNAYTSGPFSEPALYAFDLRTTDTSEYADRDIFWYIAHHTGLQYDPVDDAIKDPLGHPFHWFVDEIEYDDPHSIRMFEFDRIAYVKILESDFLSTNEVQFKYDMPQDKSKNPIGVPNQKTAINICIYTRKGSDFRTMRGGLNMISAKGFDKILTFSPDNTTLFWNPLMVGSVLRIRFNNNESAKRFRLRLEGMTYSGEVITYETEIKP